MSAALGDGGWAPVDPFQLGGAAAADPVDALARRWHAIVEQLDDDRFTLATDRAEDVRRARLWAEQAPIEERILALAEPTIAAIVLKLRVVAWHMNVTNADCVNHDGVRTNELEPDEAMVVSALAVAEQLAGAASTRRPV
jgi:hypothetical protein